MQEEELLAKGGSEHLREPLHILIEAEMEDDKVEHTIVRARETIEKLLIPLVSHYLQCN
jgi:hypothetical protein